MIFKNLVIYINQFYIFSAKKFRELYLYSDVYDKKISKFNDKNLEYKPSPILLNCIIKNKNRKNKIEEFYLSSIWGDKKIKKKDYDNLHSFFWLFSLDLKSSKKDTQKIILNWINSNKKYDSNNWDIDILSKRVIAWISNSKLTYEDSDQTYKNKINYMILKQINHLIIEIKKTNWTDNKIIGCAAIILAGLSYGEKSKYLEFGFSLLKKIIKYGLDNEGFPKSRNIKQLNLYLKYFVLIREWLKESQTEIPEYIDEAIYYFGQAYFLTSQNINNTILFNGNYEETNEDINKYLTSLGYTFKNENNEIGGYAILKNKKISLIMDIGSSPEKKNSEDYQAGALSFEINSNDKKLICNSGYYKNYKHQLNYLSKSTASHSSLTIDNHSSCKIKKNKDGSSKIERGLKITNKSIIFEKNYWSVMSEHDGYSKKYGIIHSRQIEFFADQNKFLGTDKLIKKRNFKKSNFEIRFHLMPNTKVMKTQNNESIFIELENEGWKFTCDNHIIDIESGLFLGKKNSYKENQNIFISGMTHKENQIIKWELIKIT